MKHKWTKPWTNLDIYKRIITVKNNKFTKNRSKRNINTERKYQIKRY